MDPSLTCKTPHTSLTRGLERRHGDQTQCGEYQCRIPLQLMQYRPSLPHLVPVPASGHRCAHLVVSPDSIIIKRLSNMSMWFCKGLELHWVNSRAHGVRAY
eukprot:9299354-Pyramimonas_sp.AAC.1